MNNDMTNINENNEFEVFEREQEKLAEKDLDKLTEEEEAQISNATDCFQSRNFMLQNSLKLMHGKFGGGFYIRYIQDDVKKIGWLQLIIEYPDESYKTVTLYKNSFKETSTEDEGINNETKPKNNINSKVIISWDGLTGDNTDWYMLEKYSSPNMPIPGKVIWQLIRKSYENIPIVKIHKTLSIEGMYYEMAKLAIAYSKIQDYSFMNGADRYFIPDYAFKKLAFDNNYTLNDLRCSFDMLGLFIKDKGNGYQYSKKVKGERKRFYVIKKNIYKGNGEIDESKATEFETNIVSNEEKEINRLKGQNSKLEKIIDSLPNVPKEFTQELI